MNSDCVELRTAITTRYVGCMYKGSLDEQGCARKFRNTLNKMERQNEEKFTGESGIEGGGCSLTLNTDTVSQLVNVCQDDGLGQDECAKLVKSYVGLKVVSSEAAEDKEQSSPECTPCDEITPEPEPIFFVWDQVFSQSFLHYPSSVEYGHHVSIGGGGGGAFRLAVSPKFHGVSIGDSAMDDLISTTHPIAEVFEENSNSMWNGMDAPLFSQYGLPVGNDNAGNVAVLSEVESNFLLVRHSHGMLLNGEIVDVGSLQAYHYHANINSWELVGSIGGSNAAESIIAVALADKARYFIAEYQYRLVDIPTAPPSHHDDYTPTVSPSYYDSYDDSVDDDFSHDDYTPTVSPSYYDSYDDSVDDDFSHDDYTPTVSPSYYDSYDDSVDDDYNYEPGLDDYTPTVSPSHHDSYDGPDDDFAYDDGYNYHDDDSVHDDLYGLFDDPYYSGPQDDYYGPDGPGFYDDYYNGPDGPVFYDDYYNGPDGPVFYDDYYNGPDGPVFYDDYYNGPDGPGFYDDFYDDAFYDPVPYDDYDFDYNSNDDNWYVIDDTPLSPPTDPEEPDLYQDDVNGSEDDNYFNPYGPSLNGKPKTKNGGVDQNLKIGNNGEISTVRRFRVHTIGRDGNISPVGGDILGTVGEYSDFDSGTSVGISWDGRTVAVGFRGFGDACNSVAVYQLSEENVWVQAGENIQLDNDHCTGDHTLALHFFGHIVAVGSVQKEGLVRVYQFDGIRWVQKGDDMRGDTNSESLFGKSLSMDGDGNRIIVGAPNHSGDNDDTRLAGQVKIYRYISERNIWQTDAVMYGENKNQRFGFSVSMDLAGSRVAVGSIGNGGGAEVYQNFNSILSPASQS